MQGDGWREFQVTRIIAGTYGGRRITAPTGASTRPTTDRVREAVFSRLDHLGVLEDASVVDLYAGSGALGLEAVSRGARRAVLVESAAAAARVVQRNVRGLGAAAEVVTADVAAYLRRMSGTDTRFDVAFLDPPYDVDDATLADVLQLLGPLLTPEAVVMVERSARSPEPAWPAGMERFAGKKHGETAVWFAEPVGEGPA